MTDDRPRCGFIGREEQDGPQAGEALLQGSDDRVSVCQRPKASTVDVEREDPLDLTASAPGEVVRRRAGEIRRAPSCRVGAG
jgi:hypothetical protein